MNLLEPRQPSAAVVSAAPPVLPPDAQASPIVPAGWFRIPDAIRFSGIGRTSLYALIGEGKIKSALVRKRGNLRGIRIISAAGLSNYLNSLADTPAD